MAAGRQWGYRGYDNRERDSDDGSRKKDFHLNRSHDMERRGGSDRHNREDGSAKVGDRHGDGRRHEAANGYHHRGSRRHRSPVTDSKRPHHSKRLGEREPGEVSSGSGSEGSAGSRVVAKGNRVERDENDGAVQSPTRKRKFSPIVWDRDAPKQQPSVKDSRGEKGSDAPAILPGPPPLSEGSAPSLSIDAGLVNKQSSHASPMDVEVSIDSPHDLMLPEGNERGLGEEDEDEYPTTRNISSSRWADMNDTSDAEENVVKALKKKKNNITPSSTGDKGSLKRVSTPEPGEFVGGDASIRSLSRSSDSGQPRRTGSREKDYMDTDSYDSDRDDGSDRYLETDSDGEGHRSRTPEPAKPVNRCINMLQGCRSVNEFERLNKINEGTYGVVYRARDKRTGDIVALKKVKMDKEKEGFPLTSIREINIMLSFHHPSIVDVKEVVVGSSLDSIFMVMEYMEHDLKGLMETKKQPYNQSEVKCLMLQLLEGVKYLHDNWVLHRDLKLSNLLLNNRGELKICDFGLARQYGSPLKPYTQLVVTLWYRAPELLLGAKEYSTAIDMWSIGCIMAELLANEPLFNGKGEVDQLDKIYKVLGTPNVAEWPGLTKLQCSKYKFVKQPRNRLKELFPPALFSGRPVLSNTGLDLLSKLLTYDPEKRITAEAALKHDWFREVPLPLTKEFMPTFPPLHDQDRTLRRAMKSPHPLEEQKLNAGNVGNRGLFG